MEYINNKITLTPEEYVTTRAEDQVKYLHHLAYNHKRSHSLLKKAQIFFELCIPILLIFGRFMNYYLFDLFAIVASIALLITEVIIGNSRHLELSLEIRETARTLEREVFLYKTKSGPYQFDNPTIFNDFVLMVERTIRQN